MARDDFSLAVKTLLARRVGMRCSNPNCRKPTSGPDVDPNKAVNIGVASHITAASRGGPRYDAASTPEQRQSPENGIWLCQNCGKLIDDDTRRYPAELLRSWKRVSEEAALLAVETSQSPEQQPRINDVELVRFFAQCFDRNAFKDPFNQEGSMGSVRQSDGGHPHGNQHRLLALPRWCSVVPRLGQGISPESEMARADGRDR
jgi:hypothetical protein